MMIVIMENQFPQYPGNAIWNCLKLPDDSRADVWRMMGHQVIEVDDTRGKQLLEAQAISICLQVELREYYYKEEDEKIAADEKAAAEKGEEKK